MRPQRLRSLPAGLAAAALLLLAGALSAEEPLTQDAEGNVWFRTPDGTVLGVRSNGEVEINGRVLINCREQPGGEVELPAGEVECLPGFVEIEDSFGNELEVYSTYAEAEDARGNEWQMPLGTIRVGSGGRVRVEGGGQTVTVSGAGSGVEVTTGGESVIVDGDYVRVRSAGGVTEVSGNWRGAGTRYRPGDTERILVELGAVEADDHIRVALGGDILFDFDSTAVRPDAAEQLAKVAQVIRQRSVGEVYVVGHTDSVGGDDYNRRLSQERAVSVIGWLNRNEGIPAGIMVGRGMGSRQPVAHNTMPDGSDNPAGRAQNRRVEVLLATREGVDLRAGVAGVVRVDETGVDVGGGAVRVDETGVDVGGGAVRVDAGGVRVGGVEVTPGGVQVGGVTVRTGAPDRGGAGGDARVVGDAAPTTCRAGDSCSLTCLEGDCIMKCETDATCDFACPGGDCVMRCAPGAVCTFGCTGGDCYFDCASGSECRTSCLGGDCTRS